MNESPRGLILVLPRSLLFSLLLLLCIYPAVPARGDGLFTSTRLCPNSNGIAFPNPGFDANCLNTSDGASTQNSQMFLSGGGVGSSLSASASATASFGTLGTFATAIVQNYASGTFQVGSSSGGAPFAAVGIAEFVDTWNVINAGSNGFVDLTFSTTGTVTTSDPRTFGLASVMVNNTSGGSVPGTESFSLPFTLGTLLPIDVILFGGVAFLDFPNPNPYNASGTADFSHTVRLTQVEIVNAAGNPISGASISAGSGTLYPLSPLNVVPVPSTLILFVTGMLGMGLARRKLKH